MRLVHITVSLLLMSACSLTGTRGKEVDPVAEVTRTGGEPLEGMTRVPGVEGVRVVMLGEPSHGDGAAFEVKAALVEVLHERHGFDVLLFESDLYACAHANARLDEASTGVREVMEGCLLGVWSKSAQLDRLWGYVEGARGRGARIEVGGVDPQLGRAHTRASLREELARLSASSREVAEAFAEAEPVVAALLEDPGGFMLEESSEEALVGLVSAFDGARGCAPCAPTERSWGGLLARNVLSHARTRSTLNAGIAEHGAAVATALSVARLNNTRDAQMAENLAWLLENRYAGRRVIVWTASMHAARGLDAHVSDPIYDGVVTLGDHAHAALGGGLMSVAFVASSGTYGYPGGAPKPVPEPAEGSLERWLQGRGVPGVTWWGSDALEAHGFDGVFASGALGYHPFQARWARVFDAFVHIDRMTPSTARAR